MTSRAPGGSRVFGQRVLVFVLAAVVYLPGFWWGAPRATAPDRTNAWGVDDEPPMGPLAQLHDILNPKPTQNPNLGYPMLHPFMVMGAYAPYVGWLYASGGLAKPAVEYPHGFADPERALRVLTLIAHLLSVLLAAGVVVAAFEIGRTLFDEAAGAWSAALVLTSYPMFYYARTSNVDVPVLFYTALALIPFARCLALGVTKARGAWFGALAGLAMATKEPSFASFAGIPVVLLFLRSPDSGRAGWRDRAAWNAALWAALGACVAYAVGSGMAVDPDRYFAHVAFVRERSREATDGAVWYMPHYPMTAAGHIALAGRLLGHLRDALTLPGLALAAAGLGLAAVRARRAFWFSVTAIAYLAILFWSARAAQLRYVMPATFALAVFAGWSVSSATGAWRWPLRAAGFAALAIGLLRGVDLTHAMLADSRYEAGRWLRENARPGDHVEYFGADQKNPPMESWLGSSRAVRYRGGTVAPDTSDSTVGEIVEGWRTRRPRFVLLTPDFTSRGEEPFAASCPPQVYRKLVDGSLGYRLAGHFETPALLPWVRRPSLDYPVVNPPILVFELVATAARPAMPGVVRSVPESGASPAPALN